MFTDYARLFEEEEKKFCTDHLVNPTYDDPDGLRYPIVSLEFKNVLEENYGYKLHLKRYVCEICGYPAERYLRFCYWCESDFYGIANSDKCTNCRNGAQNAECR